MPSILSARAKTVCGVLAESCTIEKRILDSTPGVILAYALSSHMAPSTEQDPKSSLEPCASGLRSIKGCDGKSRAGRRPELVNNEALSDHEYAGEEGPAVEQISADEGRVSESGHNRLLTSVQIFLMTAQRT